MLLTDISLFCLQLLTTQNSKESNLSRIYHACISKLSLARMMLVWFARYTTLHSLFEPRMHIYTNNNTPWTPHLTLIYAPHTLTKRSLHKSVFTYIRLFIILQLMDTVAVLGAHVPCTIMNWSLSVGFVYVFVAKCWQFDCWASVMSRLCTNFYSS
jgi:hypothetical protein